MNQDLEQKAILAALQIISWSGGDESTSRHAQVITYMERFAKFVLENAKPAPQQAKHPPPDMQAVMLIIRETPMIKSEYMCHGAPHVDYSTDYETIETKINELLQAGAGKAGYEQTNQV